MKKLLIITMLSLVTVVAYWAAEEWIGKKAYVEAEEENLRSEPNGQKIGTLLQSTEVEVLADSGSWAKVQLTGWIWKPSLSLTKPISQTPKPKEKQITVYVTRTGSKYHRAGCRYLSKSRIPISLKEAKARGYAPCKVCNPPR